MLAAAGIDAFLTVLQSKPTAAGIEARISKGRRTRKRQALVAFLNGGAAENGSYGYLHSEEPFGVSDHSGFAAKAFAGQGPLPPSLPRWGRLPWQPDLQLSLLQQPQGGLLACFICAHAAVEPPR